MTALEKAIAGIKVTGHHELTVTVPEELFEFLIDNEETEEQYEVRREIEAFPHYCC